ncbi:MAG: hypothetical protein NTY38_14920 [Acidobacteria bacterium]|nr:hypothetical protein [Acidobacteriota bacterium]
MRRNFLILFFAAAALGQQVVAPTPEAVGPRRGDNTNGYNISNSVEFGYRFLDAAGAIGKYRGDVNFGNGLRLLSSQLSISSRDGHGKLFDSLLLTTLGLGNDPYESATLRIEKNGLYRYDLQWRQTDYFNPALTIANGFHRLNTTRGIQDHDFTLRPQSNFRLFLGYSRNRQEGPALSTVNAFDTRGNDFPLFTDVRRQENEYRLGGEALLLGTRINVLRGWDNYKDDTSQTLAGQGINSGGATTLASLRRNEPYHGNSPFWRVHLLRDTRRWIGMNGRFTWSAGRRNFILDENIAGSPRAGINQNRQIYVFGDARRPFATGDLTVTLYPASRWTIVNQTAFHNMRMEGNSAYREINNTNLTANTLYFQYLGIRTIVNTTDANFRAWSWLSLYGGYHFSARRIRSVESSTFFGATDTVSASQENTVQAGVAGIRLQPLKALTLLLDGEIDRADRPLYPISDRNYHTLNARARYKLKTLSFSGLANAAYNNNSVAFSAHSSRSRNYSGDVSWTPGAWLSLDAGYARIHLDTLGGLAYFAAGRAGRLQPVFVVSFEHSQRERRSPLRPAQPRRPLPRLFPRSGRGRRAIHRRRHSRWAVPDHLPDRPDLPDFLPVAARPPLGPAP